MVVTAYRVRRTDTEEQNQRTMWLDVSFCDDRKLSFGMVNLGIVTMVQNDYKINISNYG